VARRLLWRKADIALTCWWSATAQSRPSGSDHRGLFFQYASGNHLDFVSSFGCCGSLFEPMALSDADWRSVFGANGRVLSSSVWRIHALDEFSVSEPRETIKKRRGRRWLIQAAVSNLGETAARRSLCFAQVFPQCPLLAQSGHTELHCTCPLLG
jgi:hypothetical protein